MKNWDNDDGSVVIDLLVVVEVAASSEGITKNVINCEVGDDDVTSWIGGGGDSLSDNGIGDEMCVTM